MDDIDESSPVPSRSELDAALQRINLRTTRSIWDAATEVGRLRSPDENKARLNEWIFELQAFRFSTRRERSADEPLYFGPLSTWVGNDGVAYSDPDVQRLPAEAVAYWEQRASQATNPILVARYADLVWTFKRQVTGERPHPDFARTAAKAYMVAATDGWFEEALYALHGAERALELAVSINDAELTLAASEALWQTEKAESPDNKPGLWGYSFRKLVLGNSPIPDPMRAAIVADMEARFSRLEDGDPWSRESAAKMLSDYYRRFSTPEKMRQLWKAVGETFERDAREDEALRASSILQHVASLYKTHGLESEYAEVTRKITAMGRKARGQMKTISQEIEIPRSELEKVVAAHFQDTLQKTVVSIAVNQTPDKERARVQLDQIVKNNPLTYMITHMITDHDGRTVATLRPHAEDPEPHLVRHMSQSMSFGNIVLTPVLARFFGEYGVDVRSFVDFLGRSVAFSDLQTNALIAGVSAYLADDYPTSAHILVPQIERSFRQLLELAGGSILKENKSGGFDLRTLDELLRDPILSDIFGENAAFYFRTLLTNKVGWNLRNDLCHGIVPWDHIGQPAAARLIHVLMLLSLTVSLDSAA